MNNLEPRIETLEPKLLVGKRLKMSIVNNRTLELWQSFMPKRKEIENVKSSDLFCMQVYPPELDFKRFNPNIEFEKWAAIEVVKLGNIPEDMETYTLAGGLYAVFNYKGLPSDFKDTFNYIFYSWLPNSDFELDAREHFEILGEKYKNNDPSSEEEVWVPVRLIENEK